MRAHTITSNARVGARGAAHDGRTASSRSASPSCSSAATASTASTTPTPPARRPDALPGPGAQLLGLIAEHMFDPAPTGGSTSWACHHQQPTPGWCSEATSREPRVRLGNDADQDRSKPFNAKLKHPERLRGRRVKVKVKASATDVFGQTASVKVKYVLHRCPLSAERRWWLREWSICVTRGTDARGPRHREAVVTS